MQSTATVCHCFGGYVLPEGLTEGEIVKLVDFDRGTYTVLCQDGRTFQIDGPSVVAVPSEFYANH